ncbi:MAG: hypothetical protein ACKVZJ_07565 [Phycisphaerales bacterium]
MFSQITFSRKSAALSLAMVGALSTAETSRAANLDHFTEPFRTVYAVTETNDLYTFDVHTQQTTFVHAINGLQPGESIRGIDLSRLPWNQPSLDPMRLMMVGSTGRLYQMRLDAGPQQFVTTLTGATGLDLSSGSVGFDTFEQYTVGNYYRAVTSSAGGYRGVPSSPAGEGHLGTTRYPDGSPASVVGLAAPDDAPSYFPGWHILGLEANEAKLVGLDPFWPTPPDGLGAGKVQALADVRGPGGSMLDLAHLAGFDMQEVLDLRNGFFQTLIGVAAFNSPSSNYTELYAVDLSWTPSFGNPPGTVEFRKIADMTLDSRTSVRFTAVAMTPTPGAATFAAPLAMLAIRRRRPNS